MTCNCIEKMEVQLRNKRGDEYHNARCRDLRIIKQNGIPQLRLAVFFEYEKPQSWGSSAKYNLPVYASHCPFCGKKYDDKENKV